MAVAGDAVMARLAIRAQPVTMFLANASEDLDETASPAIFIDCVTS